MGVADEAPLSFRIHEPAVGGGPRLYSHRQEDVKCHQCQKSNLDCRSTITVESNPSHNGDHKFGIRRDNCSDCKKRGIMCEFKEQRTVFIPNQQEVGQPRPTLARLGRYVETSHTDSPVPAPTPVPAPSPSPSNRTGKRKASTEPSTTKRSRNGRSASSVAEANPSTSTMSEPSIVIPSDPSTIVIRDSTLAELDEPTKQKVVPMILAITEVIVQMKQNRAEQQKVIAAEEKIQAGLQADISEMKAFVAAVDPSDLIRDTGLAGKIKQLRADLDWRVEKIMELEQQYYNML